MKTTLDIGASVMVLLKREASRRGCTISEVVETALRLMFGQIERKKVRPLPSFSSRGHLVDIADRDALYRAMEE